MLHNHSHNNKIATHKCQIDCTNHDQVINNLQLKSKDLYYFWRNYQWLYNRYYNQQPSTSKEDHTNCRIQINELEQQSAGLRKENKTLRIDNQSLKKQLSQNSSSMEGQYQKELNRYKEKCREYEDIRERYVAEIRDLKNMMKRKQDQYIELERENKKNKQIIVELHQKIDYLGMEMEKMGNHPKTVGLSTSQISSRNQRISVEITNQLQQIEQQIERIVNEEIQLARNDLMNEMINIMMNLSQSQMKRILVSKETRTQKREQNRSFNQYRREQN